MAFAFVIMEFRCFVQQLRHENEHKGKIAELSEYQVRRYVGFCEDSRGPLPIPVSVFPGLQPLPLCVPLTASMGLCLPSVWLAKWCQDKSSAMTPGSAVVAVS